jgi:hypothetical protein
LWLIERFIPMDATIKRILIVVVIIVVIVWILTATGLLSGLHTIRVGK